MSFIHHSPFSLFTISNKGEEAYGDLLREPVLGASPYWQFTDTRYAFLFPVFPGFAWAWLMQLPRTGASPFTDIRYAFLFLVFLGSLGLSSCSWHPSSPPCFPSPTRRTKGDGCHSLNS